MKKALAILATVLACRCISLAAQPEYGKYFTDDRLRIDLVFAGNSSEQHAYLENLTLEKCWSGTRTNLIPPFDYGEYATDVYAADGTLIFSRGFSSLFQEWRTTEEAAQVSKAFTNCAWIPFPKEPVKVAVTERTSDGKHRKMLEFTVDPADKLICREKENDFKVIPLINNGPVGKKVDICIVAEGYRAEEMDKFIADCKRLSEYMFTFEPYKSRKADFNVWIVESISEESGTDIPHQDVWKNTVAASNFYTFRIDRYLTAPDHKKVSQLASNAPCDALYVLVNNPKYGGGGIYNYYALTSSDHKLTPHVFIHEFGHSFAGLGDEYYEKDVAYNDMYTSDVEPWEPNITTQADFASKWKDMMDPETPVPTPADPAYANTVGLYEGGGYASKGVWRPYIDCRMKTNEAAAFCPVCRRAIEMMIDYYTK